VVRPRGVRGPRRGIGAGGSRGSRIGAGFGEVVELGVEGERPAVEPGAVAPTRAPQATRCTSDVTIAPRGSPRSASAEAPTPCSGSASVGFRGSPDTVLRLAPVGSRGSPDTVLRVGVRVGVERVAVGVVATELLELVDLLVRRDERQRRGPVAVRSSAPRPSRVPPGRGRSLVRRATEPADGPFDLGTGHDLAPVEQQRLELGDRDPCDRPDLGVRQAARGETLTDQRQRAQPDGDPDVLLRRGGPCPHLVREPVRRGACPLVGPHAASEDLRHEAQVLRHRRRDT
jgi:hypothetical protein